MTFPGKPFSAAPVRSHTAPDVLFAQGAVKRAFARNAFERVSCAGLGKASPKDVMRLAKALWYEGFTPQFDERTACLPHANDAAYLLDRLSRFEVTHPASRIHVQAYLQAVTSALAGLPQPQTATRVRDPLAKQWHASSDYTRFRAAILHLQGRHYKPDHWQLANPI